jgi:phenylalanyl-tRNA synthetase beta chain
LFDGSVESLAHALTIAGLEVEGIERTGEGWDRVYVGEVMSVEPHPNADRLVLATVAHGAGELTVVTGAPNIEAGQKVALALQGASLWDADSETPRKKKLKPGTIRGVRSEGMVCSGRELGLSEEHRGILVLPADAPVGALLAQYLGEEVLELDLNPNFAYANNVIGLAREVAAVTGGQLSPLGERAPLPEGEPLAGEVRAEGLASRYMLQRLDNVRVGPSSRRVRERLLASGLRPINNVVDVTNYVMLETGQPLHAFDAARVDGRVIVRAAEPGERLRTLDHQERTMTPGTVMIADERKPIGIGGIMGGLDTEVTPETTSILLEAATFEPVRIRRAARAMGLRSEASGRFEKGMDPDLPPAALSRAVALLAREAGAEPVGAPYDWCADVPPPQPIRLAYGEIERVLGIPVAPKETERILRALDFDVVAEEEGVVATPPSYRRDVTLVADLIEEVGRVHGYDHLPAVLPAGEPPPPRTETPALLERRAREWLVGAGMQEVINYDLLSPQSLEPLRDLGLPPAAPSLWAPTEDLVRVLNPLSKDREYLRPSLAPGLLANVRDNLRHEDRVSLFELDRVFHKRGEPLPEESKRLAFALAGFRAPRSPHLPAAQATIFDLKGLVQGLLMALGARRHALSPAGDLGGGAGNALALEVGGACAGVLWEFPPGSLARWDIDQGVVVGELRWEDVVNAASLLRRFEPYSRYPALKQDLAVAVAIAVPAGDVLELIRGHGGRSLREAELVEVYSGAPLPEGTKSLLYRLSFQSMQGSLTEKDASRARAGIERALRDRLGARIRGSDGP